MVEQQKPILVSFINSFIYLYSDAEFLRDLAKTEPHSKSFNRTKLCRTAAMLYVLSLEALANQAVDYILPPKVREFFLKRERKLSMLDKWELLPLFANPASPKEFDISRYPWSHFKELKRLRDDYVHPKHDRTAFYNVPKRGLFDSLQSETIPDDLAYTDKDGKERKITTKDVIYPLTRIPKDPYALLPEHLDTAKKTVDDTIAELDRLLGGKLTKDGWLTKDQMTLVSPPGGKIEDVLPRK